MSDRSSVFTQAIQTGYSFQGPVLTLGSAILDGQVIAEAKVNIPLKTMNRHGLIAGATGTGKTKTLQLLAEGLSDASVPVLLMDIKGDLSGIAAGGVANERLIGRVQQLGMTYS